jgi:2-oxoisovalerate dehydrogenase E1 component
VNGSDRGHHQFLSKALHHVAPVGVDPTVHVGDDVRTVLLRSLATICGLSRGLLPWPLRVDASAAATNIGSTLESFNLATAWKLPVCFFIENNRYAGSTTIEEVTGEPRLSARGLGFNIPSWKVEGVAPRRGASRDGRDRGAHAKRFGPQDD